MAMIDAPRDADDESVAVIRSHLQRMREDLERLVSTRANLDAEISNRKRRIAALAIAESELAGTPYVAPRTNRASPVLRPEGYRGLTYSEMILGWARQHNGRVVMRTLTEALISDGVFRDKKQATGTLYPSMRRLPGFQKVSRGVYEMQHLGSTPLGGLSIYKAIRTDLPD